MAIRYNFCFVKNTVRLHFNTKYTWTFVYANKTVFYTRCSIKIHHKPQYVKQYSLFV